MQIKGDKIQFQKYLQKQKVQITLVIHKEHHHQVYIFVHMLNRLVL